jgi:hypothetical protein
MAYTNRVSEDLYPLTSHDPRTRQVATHVSAWVNAENYHRLWFYLQVGDLGAAATLDANLQQASDAAGTGAKAIAGKSITQLTQAGGDGTDDLACIELQTEELDVDNGFEFVRFRVTIAVADCTYSASLFGTCSRYKPVPTTNWTEIVG